jgi:DNA-binding MarR family transcriptional regulator
VVRSRDPGDGRAYQVHLTDEALQIGPAVEQIYKDVFTLALQGISQDELDDFMRLFKRISENFARQRAEA